MASLVRDTRSHPHHQSIDAAQSTTSVLAGASASNSSSSSSLSRLTPIPQPLPQGRAQTSSVSPQKKSKFVDATNTKLNESLLKRMGGPSAAKAGLTKDQDEINRIIYEASKGSKYFENERKNDERITKKVEAMLQKTHERLQAVPEGSPEWTTIEKKTEAMKARVEAQRSLTQSIVHMDVDMFYCAVELKRDPSLKDKAFGVGKGVLVTASYEARKFGVRSGMASYIALKLCPHLITIPNDMQSYVSASRQIMDILRRFDENLAQASLDEAYLDITAYCRLNKKDVSDAVAQLRREVRDETGLTVSVGVAPNKMLAKIGSDKNKPDGQFILEHTKDAAIHFMDLLPVRKVPGIGRVTERMLQALGVETCGDIWRLRVKIALVLGDDHLQYLLRYYLGIGSSVVEPGKREERKSVGREHTFQPTNDPEKLFELLRESADTVEDDLKRLDFVGRKVTLICKYDNFQRFTRDQTQTQYVSTADEIYRIVRSLLEHELSVQPGLSLRLIGARVGTLKDVRKPADGGPLKRFFDKGSTQDGMGPTSPTRKRIRRDAGHPDSVTARDGMTGRDLDTEPEGELEDEESRQIRLAIAASLKEMENARIKGGVEASDAESDDDGSPSGRCPPHDPREWDLSPSAERSAATFATALYRSSPEVTRPPARARLTGNDEEIRESIRRHEETAIEKGAREITAASWFVKKSSSSIGSAASPAPLVGKDQNGGESTVGTIGGNGTDDKNGASEGLEALICPVCSKTVEVRFGSTLAGRNAQLNAHIDVCLRGDSPGGESSRSCASDSAHKLKSSKSKRSGKSSSGIQPNTTVTAAKTGTQGPVYDTQKAKAGQKTPSSSVKRVGSGDVSQKKIKGKSTLERFLNR